MSQGQDSPWTSPPQPMLLPGLSCLLWRLVKAGPRGWDSSCGPGAGPGAGGGGEEGRGRLKDAGPLLGPARSRESPRPPGQQIQGVRSKTSSNARPHSPHPASFPLPGLLHPFPPRPYATSHIPASTPSSLLSLHHTVLPGPLLQKASHDQPAQSGSACLPSEPGTISILASSARHSGQGTGSGSRLRAVTLASATYMPCGHRQVTRPVSTSTAQG